MDSATERHDLRVLVVAPFGQDGPMAATVLADAGIACSICGDISEVCSEFSKGAGALLLAYEALTDAGTNQLAAVLEQQEAWSDIPVLVFTPGTASMMSRQPNGSLAVLRNVTLVERPIRVAALVSCLRSALRARERQYLVRSLMEELRRSNQTKDAFIAAVSHELRTPLNAILGWTGMLRHTTDPERSAAAIDVIERNGRVLSQLVEDLLDLSRVAQGQFRLDTAPLDLAAVVAGAVDAVRPAAEAKCIDLDLRLAPDVPRPVGDATRLQQVIWNLVSNAVKFTPEGGRIRIELRAERRVTDERRTAPRAAEIVVTDTGFGISPELLPHIFEPFRQGHQPPGVQRRGLGLGLAIVRHLVELHGGSVVAHSDGVGRGATFRVRLPIADERVARANRSRAVATSGSGDAVAAF